MRTRRFQLSVLLCFCAALAAAQQATSAIQEKKMTQHAAGSFDVKLTPQSDPDLDPSLGRMSIGKQFHGGLAATSTGQMLYGSTALKDSGGYVAIEKVTGILSGRKGTFLLEHNGTMQGGSYYMNVVVIPDSGTGELTGLSGTMNVTITKDGKHFYDFEYSLPSL